MSKTFRVQSPDGRTFEVTAPDGATPDQVMAYAQAHYAQSPSVPAASQSQAPQQPTPDHGMIGSIGDFASALGHHIANTGVGLEQLVGHGVTAAADAALSPSNPVRQYTDATRANMDAWIANREKQYQQNTPTNAASLAGATVGEVAPWMIGVGELRAAGAIPEASALAGKVAPYVGPRIAALLGKAAPLAAEGAAYGVAQPVTTPNYGATKAGQIGMDAVTAPVAAGLAGVALKAPGAVRSATDYLSEAGRNRLAGRKFADLVESAAGDNGLSMLRGAQQTVPGEQVSLASAIPNARSVQIERALQNDPNAGPIMADARASNNALRLQAIQKLAGSDADMQAALEAREKATQPFIDEHLNYLAPAQRWNTAGQSIADVLANRGRMSGDDFNTLKQMQGVVQKVKSGELQEDDGYQALSELGQSLKSKAAQQAFDDAGQAIHANMVDSRPILDLVARMRNSNLGQNPTIRNALNTVETNIKQAQHTLGSDPTSGTGGLVPASVLDGIRSQLSGSLRQFAPNAFSGVGEREAAGLAPLRSALVDTLNARIPGYSRYLSAYARTSEPVNTFESLRELLDSGLGSGLNVSGQSQATRHALDVFLRKVERSPYGISPQAKAQITALRDDLARENISGNKVSSAGSDTGANLKMAPITRTLSGKVGSALGSAAGLTISHLLGVPFAGDLTSTAVGSLAGAGLTRAANEANARIAARVGQLAADSRAGAAAVDAVQRAKNARPSIAQILYENALPYGKPRIPLDHRLLKRASQ